MLTATEQNVTKVDLSVGLYEPSVSERHSAEKPLTPEEIKAFKQQLSQLREWLVQGVSELERRAGALDSRPRHLEGDGEGNWERVLVQQAVANKRLLLHEVMRAFERIAEQTYGRCAANNCMIGRTVLNDVPWAKYCPDCSSRQV